MGLAEVSAILWRERELLELLLFKLEEEQLVLDGGRNRWLARATREVEGVLAEIRRTELARATDVDAVSIALGIGPAPTLTMLAAASPEPWSGLLREHQAAFRTLTAEITRLCEHVDLLTGGARASTAPLHLVSETAMNAPGGTLPAPRAMSGPLAGTQAETIITTSLADFLG
jgi:hypothetical protein